MSASAYPTLPKAVASFLAVYGKGDPRDTRVLEAVRDLRGAFKAYKQTRKKANAKATASPDVGRPRSVDREELLKLWREGLTQTAIGERLHCAQSTVRLILVEIGHGQLPPR